MDFIVDQPEPSLETFFEKLDPLWSRPNQRQGFRAYALENAGQSPISGEVENDGGMIFCLACLP